MYIIFNHVAYQTPPLIKVQAFFGKLKMKVLKQKERYSLMYIKTEF